MAPSQARPAPQSNVQNSQRSAPYFSGSSVRQADTNTSRSSSEAGDPSEWGARSGPSYLGTPEQKSEGSASSRLGALSESSFQLSPSVHSARRQSSPLPSAARSSSMAARDGNHDETVEQQALSSEVITTPEAADEDFIVVSSSPKRTMNRARTSGTKRKARVSDKDNVDEREEHPQKKPKKPNPGEARPTANTTKTLVPARSKKSKAAVPVISEDPYDLPSSPHEKPKTNKSRDAQFQKATASKEDPYDVPGSPESTWRNLGKRDNDLEQATQKRTQAHSSHASAGTQRSPSKLSSKVIPKKPKIPTLTCGNPADGQNEVSGGSSGSIVPKKDESSSASRQVGRDAERTSEVSNSSAVGATKKSSGVNLTRQTRKQASVSRPSRSAAQSRAKKATTAASKQTTRAGKRSSQRELLAALPDLTSSPKQKVIAAPSTQPDKESFGHRNAPRVTVPRVSGASHIAPVLDPSTAVKQPQVEDVVSERINGTRQRRKQSGLVASHKTSKSAEETAPDVQNMASKVVRQHDLVVLSSDPSDLGGSSAEQDDEVFLPVLEPTSNVSLENSNSLEGCLENTSGNRSASREEGVAVPSKAPPAMLPLQNRPRRASDNDSASRDGEVVEATTGVHEKRLALQDRPAGTLNSLQKSTTNAENKASSNQPDTPGYRIPQASPRAQIGRGDQAQSSHTILPTSRARMMEGVLSAKPSRQVVKDSFSQGLATANQEYPVDGAHRDLEATEQSVTNGANDHHSSAQDQVGHMQAMQHRAVLNPRVYPVVSENEAARRIPWVKPAPSDALAPTLPVSCDVQSTAFDRVRLPFQHASSTSSFEKRQALVSQNFGTSQQAEGVPEAPMGMDELRRGRIANAFSSDNKFSQTLVESHNSSESDVGNVGASADHGKKRPAQYGEDAVEKNGDHTMTNILYVLLGELGREYRQQLMAKEQAIKNIVVEFRGAGKDLVGGMHRRHAKQLDEYRDILKQECKTVLGLCRGVCLELKRINQEARFSDTLDASVHSADDNETLEQLKEALRELNTTCVDLGP